MRAPQTPVTAANLRQYLDAVVEATLGAGVAAQVGGAPHMHGPRAALALAMPDCLLSLAPPPQPCPPCTTTHTHQPPPGPPPPQPPPQVEAFRSGFEAIFPLDSLAAFYEDEIEVMLCGEAHPALTLLRLMHPRSLPSHARLARRTEGLRGRGAGCCRGPAVARALAPAPCLDGDGALPARPTCALRAPRILAAAPNRGLLPRPACAAGTGEAWAPEYLAEVIKFDHGYTAQARGAAAGRACGRKQGVLSTAEQSRAGQCSAGSNPLSGPAFQASSGWLARPRLRRARGARLRRAAPRRPPAPPCSRSLCARSWMCCASWMLWSSAGGLVPPEGGWGPGRAWE